MDHIRHNVTLRNMPPICRFRFDIIFIDFSENDNISKGKINHFPLSKG